MLTHRFAFASYKSRTESVANSSGKGTNRCEAISWPKADVRRLSTLEPAYCFLRSDVQPCGALCLGDRYHLQGVTTPQVVRLLSAYVCSREDMGEPLSCLLDIPVDAATLEFLSNEFGVPMSST